MAVKVKSSPDFVPVTLVCMNCTSVLEVTEPSDFQYTGGEGREPLVAYVICPVCDELVYVQTDQYAEVQPYLASLGRVWSAVYECQECHRSTRVTEEDLYAVNTAVGYGGETWEPALRYECPVCHSSNYPSDDVPSGIERLKIDELKQRIEERREEREREAEQ